MFALSWQLLLAEMGSMRLGRERFTIPNLYNASSSQTPSRRLRMRHTRFALGWRLWIKAMGSRRLKGTHFVNAHRFNALRSLADRVRVRVWRTYNYNYEKLSRKPLLTPMNTQSFLQIFEGCCHIVGARHLEIKNHGTIWPEHRTSRHQRNKLCCPDSISKTQCRTDSITMVMIVIPNVLSFLALESTCPSPKEKKDLSTFRLNF